MNRPTRSRARRHREAVRRQAAARRVGVVAVSPDETPEERAGREFLLRLTGGAA